MKITINIPSELAPVVVKILENLEFPEEVNGRIERWINTDLGITGEQYTKAENIVYSFQEKIEQKMEKENKRG